MATNSTAFPIGVPGVQDGTKLSVDVLLNRPQVIAQDLANILNQGFWISDVFDMAGSTDSGSVAVEKPNTVASDLYLTRDVERTEPLAEAPILNADRGEIEVLPVETWTGKYVISKEARRRNDIRQFNNNQQKLANTMERKLHIRGVDVIDAAATTYSRAVAAPQTLTTAIGVAGSSKKDTDTVFAAWAIGQSSAIGEERGVEYDTVLLNQAESLKIGYAIGFNNVKDAFASLGLNAIISPRVPAGTSYMLAAKKFGGFAWEQQPTVEVSDYQTRFRGWEVEGEAAFVPYVDNPYAIYKITTLA